MLSTCLMWSASARAHVHTRFPDLANGCTDCVQIWCAASDPLDERLTQVRCGVHLHVRTCTPLSHDGASSPARPSPIKASYWLLFSMSNQTSVTVGSTCYPAPPTSPAPPTTSSPLLSSPLLSSPLLHLPSPPLISPPSKTDDVIQRCRKSR